METLTPRKPLAFTGRGGDLFAVLIVNWLLTILTLGLYYPWAKARRLQFYYQHMEMDGHPFHFHGTGRELFRGFIKAVGLIILIYAPYLIGVTTKNMALTFIGLLILIVGIGILFPLIIHGTYRYRLARSSWRGIHFGYRGTKPEIYKLCIRDFLLTIITFGIYGAWFTINLRNYVLSHVRYGSSRFEYKGDGFEFFVLNLKGYFLSLITLGIYFFWWQRDLFNYYVNNLRWHFTDGKMIRLRSTATGGGLFGLILGNLLLTILTLGIGFAWAQVRTMRYVMDNIEFLGDANLDEVAQTEAEHKDATADDLGDIMDIGIFF